jgi:hypothetical protein
MVNLEVYYMGGFYGLLFLFLMLFTTARAEITDALQQAWARFRYKQKFVRLKFITSDMSARTIYATIKDAMLEMNDKRFIINPAKAIIEGGIRTFYFVNNNSVGHDFKNNPKEMLTKILKIARKTEKAKGKKEIKNNPKPDKEIDARGSIHNIFDEPYRFDAATIQQTINQAQLSAPSVVDKLVKLFSSKNFLTMALLAVIGAGAAAFMGFLTYNELAQAEFCRQAVTTLTPI